MNNVLNDLIYKVARKNENVIIYIRIDLSKGKILKMVEFRGKSEDLF